MHDWEKQRQESAWVFNDLQSKGVDFSRAYRLDLQFMPGETNADRETFVDALRNAGYATKIYKDDLTVEATTEPIMLTLDSIWSHERKTTEIALQHGYQPDGWGFFED